MILELDCGNSWIKWRMLSQAGEVVERGRADTALKLQRQLCELPAWRASRLVSVRSADETESLCQLLRGIQPVNPMLAVPSTDQAGVVNGYAEYQHLGMDRWLAVLGASALAHAHACLVIDFGTAVTADMLTAEGLHLGGYIAPGLALMRDGLLTQTRRIRYVADELSVAVGPMWPGQCTADAVERGCQLMLKGFLLTQIEQAHLLLGEEFEVFFTGGDASMALAWMPTARHVPDLVFTGLAVACPITWE